MCILLVLREKSISLKTDEEVNRDFWESCKATSGHFQCHYWMITVYYFKFYFTT